MNSLAADRQQSSNPQNRKQSKLKIIKKDNADLISFYSGGIVQESGVLTEVRLPVACSSGNLVIEIKNVEQEMPGGIVLRSQTYPASTCGHPW